MRAGNNRARLPKVAERRAAKRARGRWHLCAPVAPGPGRAQVTAQRRRPAAQIRRDV